MRTGDQRIDDARIPATRDDREAGVGVGTHGTVDDGHRILKGKGAADIWPAETHSLTDTEPLLKLGRLSAQIT